MLIPMCCRVWAGTLCVFSRSFLMEQWMTLEATTAYAVTCTQRQHTYLITITLNVN